MTKFEKAIRDAAETRKAELILDDTELFLVVVGLEWVGTSRATHMAEEIKARYRAQYDRGRMMDLPTNLENSPEG